MKKEESDDINKKWNEILGAEDFYGDLTDELNQEGRADINWIYRKAYDEVIYFLELDHSKVYIAPKVSDFWEEPDYEDYCYDKGDELLEGKLSAFGILDVLYNLKQFVKNGEQDEDDYQDYHQSIRELKPKMQNP
jgi:hypothetical protein